MAKIIDQKGMVFGRINVIDLSVILILLSLIPIIFIGYKVIAGEKKEDTKWVSIQIKFVGVDPEFKNIILKGDTEKDEFGKVIIKLADIVSTEPSTAWIVISNNLVSDPVRKDVLVNADIILVNADILCTEKNGSFYRKYTPIRIGNSIVFTTDTYTLTGLIVGLKAGDKS